MFNMRFKKTSYLTYVSCVDSTDCKTDRPGIDYRGLVSKTMSGLDCQRWGSQEPHKHIYTSEEKNYCRNPDNEPAGPWCYTLSPDKRWEHCDIPICGRN